MEPNRDQRVPGQGDDEPATETAPALEAPSAGASERAPAPARARLVRRWLDLPLRTKGLVVVAIPVVALVAAGTTFMALQSRQQHARSRVDHSVEVQRQLAQVTVNLVNAETAARGYVLTGQTEFLEPYQASEDGTTRDVARLVDLVRDNADQQARAKQVQALSAVRLATLKRVVANAGQGVPADLALLRQGKVEMDAVRAELTAMDDAETTLLQQRANREDRLTLWLNLTMGAVIVLGLGGGIGAALLFGSGISRRIERLAANAQRLQEEEPLSDLPSGGDEVGRVGAALGTASVLLGERAQSLRRAREFLDHLITASPVVVLRQTVEDRTITYVSANVEPIFGYRPEELVGRGAILSERAHPDDREIMAHALVAATRDGQAASDLRIRHANGDHRWVHLEIRLEPVEPGWPATALVYLTDVTEAKRMEEDLAVSREQAVEASRLKSEFLANMSHEIRTP